MKKHVSLSLIICLVPSLSFAGNMRIESLLQQKQSKIERLEKCQGSTKGLKIAGLSTLGITAIGVGVNVAEAGKIKSNESQINAANQSISQIKSEIETKKVEIEKAKMAKKAEEEAKKTKEQQPANKTPGQSDQKKEEDKEVEEQKVEEEKKSNYAQSCDSNAKVNDACNTNPHADVAKCMNIGNKYKDGNIVLTCTAWSCEDGYLLKLDETKGTSLGRCVAKTEAESYCKKKGDNCKPLLKNTPRDNVTNGAYQGCDCSGGTGAEEEAEAETVVDNGMESYINTDGSEAFGLNHNGICDVYNGKWNFNVSKSKCFGLSNGEWVAKFDYGSIKGTSLCANNGGTYNGGTYATVGNPNGNNGQYCWCKMTNSTDSSLSSSSWVFYYGASSADDCAPYCAADCAYGALVNSAFRRALFVGSGN